MQPPIANPSLFNAALKSPSIQFAAALGFFEAVQQALKELSSGAILGEQIGIVLTQSQLWWCNDRV